MYQLTIVGCAGAFAGGLLAVRRCGSRALIVGLTTGGVLFLLLLTIGALCFETVSGGGGIGLLCGSLCGGAAAGILGGGVRRSLPGKTQKIIEIGRRMCYNRSKPSLWEGNQNEACEDAQRRDSEEERRPRRLR